MYTTLTLAVGLKCFHHIIFLENIYRKCSYYIILNSSFKYFKIKKNLRNLFFLMMILFLNLRDRHPTTIEIKYSYFELTFRGFGETIV